MSRTYTLRKRAEQQAETRRRIVEAAIDLHGSVGPANTTFSMIAERAGVQRHTLYAHFPDERSLSLIRGLQRVSKPGLRHYTAKDKIPRVLRGMGIAIISTSLVLMTDREARRAGIGGEIICKIW